MRTRERVCQDRDRERAPFSGGLVNETSTRVPCRPNPSPFESQAAIMAAPSVSPTLNIHVNDASERPQPRNPDGVAGILVIRKAESR
jgi:hypothetical protein